MFNPSADEVRAERERTGDGLVTCKKRLKLARMKDALDTLPPSFFNNRAQTVMLAVLKTLVEMEQGHA